MIKCHEAEMPAHAHLCPMGPSPYIPNIAAIQSAQNKYEIHQVDFIIPGHKLPSTHPVSADEFTE